MNSGIQLNHYNIVMNEYLDSLNQCVEVVDYNGVYLYKSKKFAKLEGIKANHIIGKKIEEIYYRNNDIYYLRNTLKTGSIFKDIKVEYNIKSNSRKIQGITSTYPIISDRRIVGAYSVLNPPFADKLEEIERNDNGTKYHFDDIIGNDKYLNSVIKQAKKAADSSSSILITGETGTGKELFAQSIHNYSSRSNYPFVAVNCGAIPETLIESILFGTSKGAYTGSMSKVGLFEKADRGTIFLDEIHAMPLFLQAKLLRVTQEKKLYKVGDNKEVSVNPRIISAMNVDPQKALKNGLIRPDLFYRLAVVLLELPPLREQKDDIINLGQYFINQFNSSMDKKVKKISDDVYNMFINYEWPGNTRELKNTIEHAMTVINYDDDTLCFKYLPTHITKAYGRNDNIVIPEIKSFDETISKLTKTIITKAFKENSGNINQTAKQLKMSPPRLYYRLKQLNLLPIKK
jgi:arginine utilization regulatory protein